MVVGENTHSILIGILSTSKIVFVKLPTFVRIKQRNFGLRGRQGRRVEIRFAAIDPSMRNCGIAFGTYNLGDNTYIVSSIHLVQTFPVKDKKIRKSSLDYEACREMYNKMHGHLNSHVPQIVFAEMPTGSQSASGMKSYGILTGRASRSQP